MFSAQAASSRADGIRFKRKDHRTSPCGPAVKTLPYNARGMGSIPGQEAKIPHALWPKNQNTKQRRYYNKFNKGLRRTIDSQP